MVLINVLIVFQIIQIVLPALIKLSVHNVKMDFIFFLIA